MMADTENLLPCPFCGNVDLNEGHRFAHGSSLREPAVRCSGCGVQGPRTAWNRRPDEPPVDGAKWFDECGIAYRRAHDAEAALDQWVRQAEDISGGWQRCQLELEATKERLAGAMDVLRSIFDSKAPDDALSKAAQKFVDLSSGL